MHQISDLHPLAIFGLPDLGVYAMWAVAAAIVLIGLLGFGFHDLARLSSRRIWAISSVCFAESIRKRVLWVTVLAIVGVIAVSQLQKPTDEQDAIRQTLKIALFATGMAVVLTSIILACTNLPKEIENRVIFTIVTKPTSRLEVILGKIVGFSRVSAAILFIMGLFTWGYVETRAWRMQAYISERLSLPSLPVSERATLEHYQSAGLLDARNYADPLYLNIFSREPDPRSTRRYFFGNGENNVMVPFEPNRDILFPNGPDSGIAQIGMLICVQVGWSRYGPAEQAATGKGDFALTPVSDRVPFARSGGSASPNGPAPNLSVSLADDQQFTMVPASDLQQAREGNAPPRDASNIQLSPDGSPMEVRVWLPPSKAAEIYKRSRFFVQLEIPSQNVEGIVDANPACLLAPDANGAFTQRIDPLETKSGRAKLMFRARTARAGQSLRGGLEHAPVAVFTFHSPTMPASYNDQIPFELFSTVEHSDEQVSENTDNPTKFHIEVIDLATGARNELDVLGENRHTIFFNIPANAITTGAFDVLVWCRTSGDSLGLFDNSVQLVLSRENFAFNLFKSLVILWMMTILVIAIAVFSSTFLSWPIAIVLTVVILLGHWGVNSLSDESGAALGRQVVTDMFGSQGLDQAQSRVISETVSGLTTALDTVSAVLPDISQFDAIDDIQRGVSIHGQTLFDALQVMLCFGLPLSVLAYVILLNKEVAP